MKKLRLLIVFIFIGTQQLLFSQNNDSLKSAVKVGNVEIIQDNKVNKLIDKRSQVNAETPTKGYRVKIHFGSDKNKAYEAEKAFTEKFPEISAYTKYDQPNFNVRVGDFRTKLEAYKCYKEIQSEYPAAFIVQDEIEFPLLDPPVVEKIKAE